MGGTKEVDIEKGQNEDQQEDADQVRLAKVGAYGIIRESIKCYTKQAHHFSRILFTLGIPALLYMAVSTTISPDVGSQFHPRPAKVEAASAAQNSNGLAEWIIRSWNRLFVDRDFRVWSELFSRAIPPLGFLIGGSGLNLICQALWYSGTIYTVGLIYYRPTQLSKDSDVPFFEDVLRKAPRLLYRVIRTLLWTAILYTMLLVNFMISLIVICHFSSDWAGLLCVIPTLSYVIGAVAIGILGDVAASVAILDPEENSYGLEALKMARVLLKGKWGVAVRLVIVWALIFVSILFLKPAPFASSPWDPIRLLLISVTCLVAWVINQFQVISVGVLYVSLKAFHGESVTVPETEEKTKWTSISGSTGTDGRIAPVKLDPGANFQYSLVSV